MHHLFADGRGSSATPLSTQTALLLMKLSNLSHASNRRLLQVNHKTIEDLENRLSGLACGKMGGNERSDV